MTEKDGPRAADIGCFSGKDTAETPVGGEATLRLYTAPQAAALLQVSPSWLRKKATARQVPCTFVGRYLRFSVDDIVTIMQTGARPASSNGPTS